MKLGPDLEDLRLILLFETIIFNLGEQRKIHYNGIWICDLQIYVSVLYNWALLPYVGGHPTLSISLLEGHKSEVIQRYIVVKPEIKSSFLLQPWKQQ